MIRNHNLARAAALGLLASAAFALTAGDGPEFRELPNFHRVNASLYRGARPKAGGLKILAGMGVKTDLDLQPEAAPDNAEAGAAKAAGLHYINLPLSSFDRPARSDVDKALALINDPANQPVFVHCKRGADRTGTIIAAYRITHDGWSADAALSEAKLYSMGWWQREMMAFIREFAAATRPVAPPAAPASPAPAGRN